MNITPVNCPVCNRQTIVLWMQGADVFCDFCARSSSQRWKVLWEEGRLFFCPKLSAGIQWLPTESPFELEQLRKFIRACSHPSEAGDFEPYLVTSRKTISSLQDLLELFTAFRHLRKGSTNEVAGQLSFTPTVPVRKVSWKILESAGNSWGELVRHFQTLQRVHKDSFDVGRLKAVHDLNPNQLYIGEESFRGYVVFIFDRANKAVLECPKTGNAVYLMHANDWKSLSQLSKTELLESHRKDVRRVIHAESWLREIKSCLKVHTLSRSGDK